MRYSFRYLCAFLIISLSFVPSLSSWTQQNGLARSPIARPEIPNSKIALIRSGDLHMQQQFLCELYSGDRQKMESMALVDLPNIGGWYAIQIYRELLSPEARIRYYRAKAKADQAPSRSSEPRTWSLTQLPKIVPNPPLNLPDPKVDNQELFRQAQLWKDWIAANESSLRELQPTGDGLDLSGRSCADTHTIPSRSSEHPHLKGKQ